MKFCAVKLQHMVSAEAYLATCEELPWSYHDDIISEQTVSTFTFGGSWQAHDSPKGAHRQSHIQPTPYVNQVVQRPPSACLYQWSYHAVPAGCWCRPQLESLICIDRTYRGHRGKFCTQFLQASWHACYDVSCTPQLLLHLGVCLDSHLSAEAASGHIHEHLQVKSCQ